MLFYCTRRQSPDFPASGVYSAKFVFHNPNIVVSGPAAAAPFARFR